MSDNINNESDDDIPTLSAHSLAALQEFMREQAGDIESGDNKEMPSEDWQLSQFWYDDNTAETLAKEALAIAGDHGRVACVSSPTLYKKLLELKPSTCRAYVFEYDKRFNQYGEDFIFFDYNDPLNIPKELKESFDLVVADPPFLSEECLLKTSMAIKFLAKERVLLCTGATMEEHAERFLHLKRCKFLPKHKNNLANEFRCFANYPTIYLDR